MPPIGTGKIYLLGQFSLFADPEAEEKLQLRATADIDAILDGSIFFMQLFRKVAKDKGLIYDEDSNDIGIPTNSSYSLIYESHNFKCYALDPMSTLLCKAIKAKEKNRILICRALEIYGDQLGSKIKEFGGDIDYFRKGK